MLKPITPTSKAVTFISSDKRLDGGFEWAKQQAYRYVRVGDLVGDWYEAALPGRRAFCMRDTTHQSTGAAALGLSAITKNMLRKFAQSIAESRDFCSFWEIDRQYRPAPVDYTSDEDFWYNLPANFDVLDACLRQFLWTGDEEYLRSEDFTRFYDLTVTRYVERWDTNGDGILERAADGSRRGIASYDETEALRGAEVMSDMVAIQAQGYEAYATLCHLRGLQEQAARFREKARLLRKIFAENWWDRENARFYKARFANGRMAHGDLASSHLALYFGGITELDQLKSELDLVAGTTDINVEALTYFPGIFYRYNQPERAFHFLSRLIEPRLKRRTYPEVSFCVVGDCVQGLMGSLLT